MEYFKVLIVGASGKGKTYAGRNLNQETTGVINVENKPLPFKHNFKYHSRPSKFHEVAASLVEFGKNPEITSIFIDSLSAFNDLLLAEARATKSGFDIWNKYNEEIGRFFTLIKKCPKHIFITAHYEVLGVEGTLEKRVKVKGREWEGVCEKEFAVVLYADSNLNEQGLPSYWLNTFQEATSAKCPPDLFGWNVLQIPNDYNFILEKIQEFTSEVIIKK